VSYSQPASSKPPLSADQDHQWAMVSHFLNIILLVPALVIYLVFGQRGPKTHVESKEALNWTINVTGVVIVGSILSGILGAIPIVGWIISILLSLVIWIAMLLNLIFAIIGGVRVNTGGSYRYPLNYRWIK
jgi:uncharacterized Tic20 family protein